MTSTKAALLGLMIPVALVLPAVAEQPGPRGDGAMIFERLDADGDGSVTLAEFGQMRMTRLAERDANGDGVLDREELLAGAVHGTERRIDRMIERHDADGDGAIGAGEIAVTGAGRHGPGPARLIGRFDADGDGALSRAEFAAGLDAMRGHGGSPRGGRGGGVGHGPDRG